MDVKEQLSILRRRKPFHPIRITFTDGRAFDIEDPFLYGLGLTTMMIAFKAGGREQFPLSNIVSVEELQPTG
jgi:hypothetical protein